MASPNSAAAFAPSSDAGGAALSPPTCPGVEPRRAPCAAPWSCRSTRRWHRRSRPSSRRGRLRARLSGARRLPPPTPGTKTTGTLAALSAPPAPSGAPSSELHRARWGGKRRCFSAQEVEKRVMRLAGNRRSQLAKEVHAFVAAIRRRPLLQPDGDWKAAFDDTRDQMNATRNYLARKLGTGGSEEEEDALERCVQKLLYEPVFKELYHRAMLGLWRESCVRDMALMVRRHRRVGVSPAWLGAPPMSPAATERVRATLLRMQSARLPCDKLDLLATAAEDATKIAEEENGIIVNSDNLIPLISWILMDIGMIYAIIEAEMMLKLLPPEKAHGKAGFYLTILYCACVCVKTRPDERSRTITSTETATAANKNSCDAAAVSLFNNTTCDEAAEVGDGRASDVTPCDEINSAVRPPLDDDMQKPEPDADSLERASEGYCSDRDRDRDRSSEPVELAKVDNADHDSCFGDDCLLFQSKTSLCSWSSNVDLDAVSGTNDSGTWSLYRSFSNLSTDFSDESLYESDIVNKKTAQLDSAGTLFSAVPVLLTAPLMV
ncbi:uncharacterized protein LOC126161884 isoform X1 [Schistocerca cancellata]|uniref:uncharacterized protein LOC126161884 isoform X1 n=1 Tax=Schistocerca cancellata TaxID=274614 RepID=UPI0021186BAC|nr:uncharacterized protein LOC126161884 isoform X1 [Schistocerca cancellata]